MYRLKQNKKQKYEKNNTRNNEKHATNISKLKRKVVFLYFYYYFTIQFNSIIKVVYTEVLPRH